MIIEYLYVSIFFDKKMSYEIIIFIYYNIMFGFLFYSSRCEGSANFIRHITSEKINNLFNMISIDTMSTEQILSLGIKRTPMVVLRNQNNETIGVHEGSAAFEWLNNLIQFRRQNMAKIVDQNRKKLIQSNNSYPVYLNNNLLKLSQSS